MLDQTLYETVVANEALMLGEASGRLLAIGGKTIEARSFTNFLEQRIDERSRPRT